MKIIPAIDLKGGKVVRLAQGRAEKETVYSEDPIAVAVKWDSYGVDMIHIVDLDGAMEGSLKNFEIVKAIARKVEASIELGGGIRDMDAIKMVFGGGVDKICLGTMALDREFLGNAGQSFMSKIVVSIDAKDGFVYSKGWLNKTKTSVLDLVRHAEDFGITTINYTDISRDGMLEGPNIKSLTELLKNTRLDVIAAGGVSTIEDVKKLKALEKEGLSGMIIGKALYENKIDLGEAIKICSQKG